MYLKQIPENSHLYFIHQMNKSLLNFSSGPGSALCWQWEDSDEKSIASRNTNIIWYNLYAKKQIHKIENKLMVTKGERLGGCEGDKLGVWD